jgi:hypothetical protein
MRSISDIASVSYLTDSETALADFGSEREPHHAHTKLLDEGTRCKTLRETQ